MDCGFHPYLLMGSLVYEDRCFIFLLDRALILRRFPESRGRYRGIAQVYKFFLEAQEPGKKLCSRPSDGGIYKDRHK